MVGHGSFGVVSKGRWKEKDIAVKCIRVVNKLTRDDQKAFLKELNIHASLNKHENIVHLHAYCLEPLALVMEYVQLGTLCHLLHGDNLSEMIVAKMNNGIIKKAILTGIVQGMVLLHTNQIIHGDLKSQNILITGEYTAKICDFGLARLRAQASTSLNAADNGGVCGTPAYMAPELLESGKCTNEKTDIYSFGILLNEIVQKKQPYYHEYSKNFKGKGIYVATMHAKAGYRPEVTRMTPRDVKDLIEACWAQDPTWRPLFDVIAKRLVSLVIPNSFYM